MPTGSRFRKLREAYTTTSSGRNASAATVLGFTADVERRGENGSGDDATEPRSPPCRTGCSCCCFWSIAELGALPLRLDLGAAGVSRVLPSECWGSLASAPSRNKNTGLGGPVGAVVVAAVRPPSSAGCGEGLHATQGMTDMVTPSSVSPALFCGVVFFGRQREGSELLLLSYSQG